MPGPNLEWVIKLAQKEAVLRRLYDFAKFLGYNEVAPQPHEEMCAWLERLFEVHIRRTNRQHYGLLLVPRGCFKTTIATICMAIFILILDPNARILISSHHHEYSKQLLEGIKGILEFNEKFKEVFGDWKAGSQNWNETNITIAPRVLSHPQPSIDTCGVDSPRTGGHYTHILIDDLYNEITAESEAGRRKAARHIWVLKPILEPDGYLLVTGTRWHHLDYYGEILEEDAKRVKDGQPERWEKLIHSVVDDQGNLYFPSRITEEFLADLKRELPARLFACWYYNQPIEDESIFFPKMWWKIRDFRYNLNEHIYPQVALIDADEGDPQTGVVSYPVYVTIAHDPAVSERDTADANGITVVATDPLNRWFVLEARKAYGPEKALEWIEYFVRKYKPHTYSFEPVGSQKLWRRLVHERLAKAGLRVGIHEYSGKARSGARSKRARIEMLQPKMKAGELIIGRGLPDLLRELETYPQTKHEDLLDSLAQHFEVARKPDLDQVVPYFEDKMPAEDVKKVKPLGPSGGISSSVMRGQ